MVLWVISYPLIRVWDQFSSDSSQPLKQMYKTCVVILLLPPWEINDILD